MAPSHLQVVASLMHEIECILHEYLSFNWDRVEDIYDANAVYLAPDGLACSWKSHSSMQVPALEAFFLSTTSTWDCAPAAGTLCSARGCKVRAQQP